MLDDKEECRACVADLRFTYPAPTVENRRDFPQVQTVRALHLCDQRVRHDAVCTRFYGPDIGRAYLLVARGDLLQFPAQRYVEVAFSAVLPRCERVEE